MLSYGCVLVTNNIFDELKSYRKLILDVDKHFWNLQLYVIKWSLSSADITQRKDKVAQTTFR